MEFPPMPTRRTQIPRPPRSGQITPEVLALFLRCRSLQPIYLGCLRAHCGRQEHCVECREFLDAGLRLDTLLGIQPWDESLLDCETDEPPPEVNAARYRRGRRLLLALEQAVAAK
jgi:hypothetical protein